MPRSLLVLSRPLRSFALRRTLSMQRLKRFAKRKMSSQPRWMPFARNLPRQIRRRRRPTQSATPFRFRLLQSKRNSTVSTRRRTRCEKNTGRVATTSKFN